MLCSKSLTATCTWKRFMILSFRGWTGGAGAASAAVLCQVADQLIHVFEVGAVDDEAPVLAAFHQAGARQVRKMERERGRRQVELFADAAGGEAFGTGFH